MNFEYSTLAWLLLLFFFFARLKNFQFITMTRTSLSLLNDESPLFGVWLFVVFGISVFLWKQPSLIIVTQSHPYHGPYSPLNAKNFFATIPYFSTYGQSLIFLPIAWTIYSKIYKPNVILTILMNGVVYQCYLQRIAVFFRSLIPIHLLHRTNKYLNNPTMYA